MNEAVAAKIRAMLRPAIISEAQTVLILAGWQRLFDSLQLADHQQMAEFEGVMRARLQSGTISLVAPVRIREA